MCRAGGGGDALFFLPLNLKALIEALISFIRNMNISEHELKLWTCICMMLCIADWKNTKNEQVYRRVY